MKSFSDTVWVVAVVETEDRGGVERWSYDNGKEGLLDKYFEVKWGREAVKCLGEWILLLFTSALPISIFCRQSQ